MPNNDYDDLFDQWGQSFNVDPQLVKSIFQAESGSTLNGNPMGIQPETAATIAKQMGWNPQNVNVADMRWAVPIATRVLADGLNATQTADGAAGYYNSGSTDPKQWRPGYIANVAKIYPTAGLLPPDQRQQPSGNGIVDTATSQLGQSSGTIGGFLRANNQSLNPTQANWCAAFVNGVLSENGVQGTTGAGKNVATSFLGWGDPVQGDPQAGDVLVQPRGHPLGGLGGHVGIFAGKIADAPDGQSFYLMESGNLGGRVSYSWEPAGSVVARRAPQTPQPQQQAAAQ